MERKLFVVIRQTRQGQVFDVYGEDRYQTRIKIASDLSYEQIGESLASFTPMNGSVTIEMRKLMEHQDYPDSDCA